MSEKPDNLFVTPLSYCANIGSSLPVNSKLSQMTDVTIDPAAMGRLAKALTFICGPTHPTTVALKLASESGLERDIKNARALFIKLKPGDRNAALAMLG